MVLYCHPEAKAIVAASQGCRGGGGRGEVRASAVGLGSERSTDLIRGDVGGADVRDRGSHVEWKAIWSLDGPQSIVQFTIDAQASGLSFESGHRFLSAPEQQLQVMELLHLWHTAAPGAGRLRSRPIASLQQLCCGQGIREYRRRREQGRIQGVSVLSLLPPNPCAGKWVRPVVCFAFAAGARPAPGTLVFSFLFSF
jgi:hypothetical protein